MSMIADLYDGEKSLHAFDILLKKLKFVLSKGLAWPRFPGSKQDDVSDSIILFRQTYSAVIS